MLLSFCCQIIRLLLVEINAVLHHFVDFSRVPQVPSTLYKSKGIRVSICQVIPFLKLEWVPACFDIWVSKFEWKFVLNLVPVFLESEYYFFKSRVTVFLETWLSVGLKPRDHFPWYLVLLCLETRDVFFGLETRVTVCHDNWDTVCLKMWVYMYVYTDVCTYGLFWNMSECLNT